MKTSFEEINNLFSPYINLVVLKKMYVAVALFSPGDFILGRLSLAENRFIRIANWINKNTIENINCKVIIFTDVFIHKGFLSIWINLHLTTEDNIDFIFISHDELKSNLVQVNFDNETGVKLEKYVSQWLEKAEEILVDNLPDGYLDLLTIPREFKNVVDSYGVVYPMPDLDELYECSIDESRLIDLFNLSYDPSVNLSMQNLCLDICLQNHDITDELGAQEYLLDVAALIIYLHEASGAGDAWSSEPPEWDEFLDALPISHFTLGLYADAGGLLGEENILEAAFKSITDNRKYKMATLLVDYLGGHTGTVFTLWQAMGSLNAGFQSSRFDAIFEDVGYDDYNLLEFSAYFELRPAQPKENNPTYLLSDDWVILSSLDRMIDEISDYNFSYEQCLLLKDFRTALKDFPYSAEDKYCHIRIEQDLCENNEGRFNEFILKSKELKINSGILENFERDGEKEIITYYWQYPKCNDKYINNATLMNSKKILEIENGLTSMLESDRCYVSG